MSFRLISPSMAPISIMLLRYWHAINNIEAVSLDCLRQRHHASAFREMAARRHFQFIRPATHDRGIRLKSASPSPLTACRRFDAVVGRRSRSIMAYGQASSARNRLAHAAGQHIAILILAMMLQMNTSCHNAIVRIVASCCPLT